MEIIVVSEKSHEIVEKGRKSYFWKVIVCWSDLPEDRSWAIRHVDLTHVSTITNINTKPICKQRWQAATNPLAWPVEDTFFFFKISAITLMPRRKLLYRWAIHYMTVYTMSKDADGPQSHRGVGFGVFRQFLPTSNPPAPKIIFTKMRQSINNKKNLLNLINFHEKFPTFSIFFYSFP